MECNTYVFLCIILEYLLISLATGIFLPVQFIPSLRKKYVRLHRISGRFLLGLLILASICRFLQASFLDGRTDEKAGVVIGPYTFTGTLATQTAVWTLASLLAYCMVKSYQGILKFRIDVHRAWMIRTWGISGSVSSPTTLQTGKADRMRFLL